MKTFATQAAQGDVLLRRIDKLPGGLTEAQRADGRLIIAHSETGHHHYIDRQDAKLLLGPESPMVCYLVAESPCDLVHGRPWDTHETISIPAGMYEVRRQREYTPEGYRRVED